MTDLSQYETETAAAAELARQGFDAQQLELGRVYRLQNAAGAEYVVDTDEYAEKPRYLSAARQLRDVDSLVAYLSKHGIEGSTELYADDRAASILAVIDSHDWAGSDVPQNWQRHTALLQLTKTPAWIAWTGNDKEFMSQDEFADFIEDRASDVERPSAAELISVARHIEATNKVDFKSAVRDSDGQITFRYEESNEAKAKGDLTIPETILLNLRPYAGGPVYRVQARFRYRIRSEKLSLGYVLDRPDEVLERAFADVVAELRDGRDEQTLSGAPFDPILYPIYFGKAAR
jgi:uncharacterized protein YfdQ (DUF2303 family)